jgi:hypothetical protein
MSDRENSPVAIPHVALVLGLAGLIPFVASAAASLVADTVTSQLALKSLAAYAAVILSFLGGVRWGVLLPERARFDSYGPAVISVLPSIIAWCALLLDTRGMLVLLLIGLLAQYLIDSEWSPLGQGIHFPRWYPRLRLLLSAGACACVAAGLYSTF